MKPGSRVVGDEHWWTRPDQVAALYRWLVDHEKLDTTDPDGVQAFLAAPWERSSDFRAMQEMR